MYVFSKLLLHEKLFYCQEANNTANNKNNRALFSFGHKFMRYK